MKSKFSFTKVKPKTRWELLGGFLVFMAGADLVRRHWHHRHKVVYVGGSLLVLSALGFAGMQVNSSATTDTLHIAAVSCNEGTSDGQCVFARTGVDTDRSKKCVNGQIIEDNQACGCPAGTYPWLDGSCTHQPQLKIFNEAIPYCVGDSASNINNCPSYNDLPWIAAHYDITGAHAHHRVPLKALNKTTRLYSYVNLPTFTPSEVKSGYPTYCASHSCASSESAYLHFIEDTQVGTRTEGYICRPGFDPSNRPVGWDINSPGCSTSATDHFARATSTAASRVNDPYLPGWRWMNYRSADWLAYTQNKTTNIMNYAGVVSDYVFSDIAAFTPMNSNLEYSEVYDGIPTDAAHAASHPRVQETFNVQANLRTYVSNYFGQKKEFIVNSINPAEYLVYPWKHTGFQGLDAINYFQLWEVYENSIGAPMGGGGYAHTYTDYLRSKTILQESLQGNYRFILSGYNYAASEVVRSKKFLTSYYYLLNNKNLIYEYYDATSQIPPAGSNPGTERTSITDFSWTPLLEYNIGRPVTIPTGKTDVFGAAATTGTTEHYLFASGIDPSTTNNARTFTNDSNCKTAQGAAIQKNYYIFARNYSKALVLTKFREYCGFTDSSSATTHDLGGTYYQLKDDGTVDTTPITSITLKNQEGAILIPASVVANCPESWTCSDWNACSSGQQSRQCWDLNTCGTVVNKPGLTQSCGASACIEAWTCSGWSACANGQQTKTCTDTHACGTTANRPALSQSCGSVTPPTGCTESWTCTAWSACTNGQQSKTCTDANRCGTTASRPSLTQSCSTNCTANYLCNDWSGCSDNKQTRTCTDQNRCSLPGFKNETRVCQETTLDIVAPQTGNVVTSAILTKNWLTLTLTGTDNQTASNKLRFNYSHNGGLKKSLTGSTLTLRHLTNGPQTIAISAVDEANNEDASPTTIQFTVNATQRIITIPSSGGPSLVRVFDNQGALLSQFNAFSAWRRLGGSVALIDKNNDGTEEIAVAPGRGGKPEVKLFDQAGKSLSSFLAYPENFRGGVNVAAADLDGDGTDELITAPASGTGPLLRVFKPTGEMIAEISAFDREFRGGVNITAGMLDASGKAIIAVAPASNGQPLVSVFALESGKLVLKTTKEVITTGQLVGISLSIAAVNGSEAQIIVSLTEGQQPAKVFLLSSSLAVLKELPAGSQNFTGGLRVATGDIDSFDNKAEIVVSRYSGSRQKIDIYSPGADFNRTSVIRSFNPYGWSRFGINVVVGSWK